MGWKTQRSSPRQRRSRFDSRFYCVGALVLSAAIAAKLAGADGFHAYPTIALGLGPATVALSGLLVLSGLAPLQRRPRRSIDSSRRAVASPAARPAPPRGSAAAPFPGGAGV